MAWTPVPRIEDLAVPMRGVAFGSSTGTRGPIPIKGGGDRRGVSYFRVPATLTPLPMIKL